MNLFESYKTAKDKYGEDIVKTLYRAGIPDKYLLSACRFYCNNISVDNLSNYFKQWMAYVVRNNKSIDVNKLSFDQFYQTIQEYKYSYGIPNKIYDDGIVSIGKINSSKDIAKFPVKNDWCIKQPGIFQKYENDGFSFYIVDNGNESNYVRYVILMIGKDGDKYYYDLDNEKMTPDSISEFQTHLTQDAIAYIQNINENKELKTNKNMTKIQINENDIRQMVNESVERILREYNEDADNYYGGGLPDKYFDEDENIEAAPGCDGYIVEDSKTGEIISIFRDKDNAIRKCDENHRWTFWGFNFKD